MIRALLILGCTMLNAQEPFVDEATAAALLIKPMNLVYPPLAKYARIAGLARCEVLVGEDGNVKSVQVLTGHPLLAPAAMQAVMQMRFQPYELRGKTSPFRFIQEINFRLVDKYQMVERNQPAPPRQECRWRDEDRERALRCLEKLKEKTAEEHIAWANLIYEPEQALEILKQGLPATKRNYLELAESLGQYESARKIVDSAEKPH